MFLLQIIRRAALCRFQRRKNHYRKGRKENAAKFAKEILGMVFFANFAEYLCAFCGNLFALTAT